MSKTIQSSIVVEYVYFFFIYYDFLDFFYMLLCVDPRESLCAAVSCLQCVRTAGDSANKAESSSSRPTRPVLSQGQQETLPVTPTFICNRTCSIESSPNSLLSSFDSVSQWRLVSSGRSRQSASCLRLDVVLPSIISK